MPVFDSETLNNLACEKYGDHLTNVVRSTSSPLFPSSSELANSFSSASNAAKTAAFSFKELADAVGRFKIRELNQWIPITVERTFITETLPPKPKRRISLEDKEL